MFDNTGSAMNHKHLDLGHFISTCSRLYECCIDLRCHTAEPGRWSIEQKQECVDTPTTRNCSESDYSQVRHRPSTSLHPSAGSDPIFPVYESAHRLIQIAVSNPERPFGVQAHVSRFRSIQPKNHCLLKRLQPSRAHCLIVIQRCERRHTRAVGESPATKRRIRGECAARRQSAYKWSQSSPSEARPWRPAPRSIGTTVRPGETGRWSCRPR